MNYIKEIQAVGISSFTLLAAYFDSTITFVFALLGAFAFNILAGMKADEVKIKLTRVSWFRVLRLTNFSGNKLKDSLAELCLIFFCTYFIKGIMDLTKLDDKSVYAVQVLIWLALYFYLRNSFKNLATAYPRIKWIKAVYFIVSFGGKQKLPKVAQDAIDFVDKEEEIS